jgi:sarcosine oxidase
MKVAVVGGGVVGLSATAALVRSGVDVVCFERSGVLMG